MSFGLLQLHEFGSAHRMPPRPFVHGSYLMTGTFTVHPEAMAEMRRLLFGESEAPSGVSVGLPWMPLWATAILVAMVALDQRKDDVVSRRQFITLGRSV